MRLLGALELWRRDPPPALVVHPRRAVDAARAAILMQAAAPELERRAARLSALVRDLARVRRAVAQADADLFTAESAAADTQVVADTAAARGQTLASALATPEERAAQARARAQSGLVDAPDHSDALGPERLTPPVPEAPMIGFGAAWPQHGVSEGVVWAPAPDAAVVSPVTGRIVYAGPLKGFALALLVQTSPHWRVVLAGLQTITVAPGAPIAAGEAVGRMAPGRRGGRRGGVLYLELRRGVLPIDPSRRLRRPAATPSEGD